jgi:hypothetical protein
VIQEDDENFADVLNDDVTRIERRSSISTPSNATGRDSLVNLRMKKMKDLGLRSGTVVKIGYGWHSHEKNN